MWLKDYDFDDDPCGSWLITMMLSMTMTLGRSSSEKF